MEGLAFSQRLRPCYGPCPTGSGDPLGVHFAGEPADQFRLALTPELSGGPLTRRSGGRCRPLPRESHLSIQQVVGSGISWRPLHVRAPVRSSNSGAFVCRLDVPRAYRLSKSGLSGDPPRLWFAITSKPSVRH
jgi:hypothetical protein